MVRHRMREEIKKSKNTKREEIKKSKNTKSGRHTKWITNRAVFCDILYLS